MTRNLLTSLLIAVGNILSATAAPLDYSKFKPLLFGIDLDYAPLEYVDKHGMPQGLDVELTKELMHRLKIPYTYRPNTWANISGDIIHGRVDLGMMVYSPYRDSIVNYSRAVFHMYYQVVYRKDAGAEFDMRHIKGKSVAYMSSRPITDTLSHAGAELHVVRDLPKAISDLSKGKYDAVVCFRYQARYHIKNQGLTNLKAIDLTLIPREYCYVSKNRNLIRAIDRELVKMEKDGVIDRIYGDYIATLGYGEIPSWVYYLSAAGVIVFLIVIVVLQRINSRRLEKEMRRAQKSERLKAVFLANVSHALRTPLNAIIGFSDILMKSGNDDIPMEERQEMDYHIHKNGKQLLYFINELLQLSDIEGNGLQYHMTEADIGLLMSACIEATRPQVEEGVKIVADTPHQQLIATIDTSQVRLLTMHLLSNAARYTHEGNITVSYEARDNGLYIAVKDTGEGINEQLQEDIFTLLNNQNTFLQENTPGLGLSICKAVVDALHGKVGAQSRHGEGSTFWYWIPCKTKY